MIHLIQLGIDQLRATSTPKFGPILWPWWAKIRQSSWRLRPKSANPRKAGIRLTLGDASADFVADRPRLDVLAAISTNSGRVRLMRLNFDRRRANSFEVRQIWVELARQLRSNSTRVRRSLGDIEALHRHEFDTTSSLVRHCVTRLRRLFGAILTQF